MALSQDGGLLVLGNTNGAVTLWGTTEWKPLKVFEEVHGLPLTAVAPRPYAVRLKGEDDGVEIHARTASADGTLAYLTLQRHVPKSASTASSSSDGGIMLWIHRFIVVAITLWVLSPLAHEASKKCKHTNNLRRCLIQDVLIAPASRPGISVPPY